MKIIRIRVRRDTITLSAKMFGEALLDPAVAGAIIERAITHSEETGRVVKITLAKPLTVGPVVRVPMKEIQARPKRQALRLIKGGAARKGSSRS